ncbi:MAG TPA: hypothetical protein P5042_06370 [Candidatus Izemoplasmatales bacterium]|nr:hypothetical protein [Candidatus Izemoplasmatales bacterium]
MILEVETEKDLQRFILYVKELYKNHKHYVFPLFETLSKELNEEVLKKGKYKAILSLDSDGKIQGRLLYTYDYSKHAQRDICYFSFFDCINDQGVADELFLYMETDMKKDGIFFSEGTFAPYDPDTRRGILIKGFDSDPSLFTSYNYEYYGSLLEKCGYDKVYDTFTIKAEVCRKSEKRLNAIDTMFRRHFDVRIDSLDYKHLERDLEDVHRIFQEATNELIYQDAPSIDMIRNVATNMKFFIEPDYIKIARENGTDKPVAFCLVLPDYNQVFKLTKGKILPLKMLLGKRKITRARGVLQYVVPEYQKTGLIGSIYQSVYSKFREKHVTEFVAGTMMEKNPDAYKIFDRFGGHLHKVYRIYGKERAI